MAKKQLHGPVIHLDPKTGLPICDPKSCEDKLVSKFDKVETNYKWVGGPVEHMFYFSLCSECGRRTITNKDKKLTNESFKRGTDHNGVDPEIRSENG